MFEQIFGQLNLRNILVPLVILVAFIILTLLFQIFLARFIKKLTRKTKITLDDALFKALHKPFTALIALAGVYLAVLSLPEEVVWRSYATGTLAAMLSLLGIYSVVAILDTVIKWYRQIVVREKRDIGFGLRMLSVCWVIMVIIAIWLAVIAVLGIIGIRVTPVTSWLGEHGWRITLIIVISVLAAVATGEIIPRLVIQTLSRRYEETEEEIKKRGNTLSRVIVDTGQVLIILIALFMILSELKIDITPILASAGVIGIAIGFGAQSLVKDFVAGLFIILENQYRVGDVVKIADVAGIVEDMNLRRTVLRDLDGIVHSVPNGEIRVASNFTKEWSRVNLNVSVAYGEDLDHVISVINHVGNELAADPQWAPLILKAPQALRVDNFGDSGIEIKILGDTKPIRQWDVMGELRKRLKKAFDEAGIEIPWPHTKIYFGNSPYPIDKRNSSKKNSA